MLTDIRFWILLCFILRLIGITNPPLEVSHNWRQTLGTMVTRNFMEVDRNLLYPRIDIGGDHAGIAGMEFPLLSYGAYLMALIFGYQHWYGRLLNLIVSSFGTYYFFCLVRDQLKCKRLAFYSTMVFLFSLWFSCSRKIMPDTLSMSFVIAALYHGFRYLESSAHHICYKRLDIVLFGVFSTCGMLTKLPSGYLLVILVLPFFLNQMGIARRIVFAAVSLLSLGSTLAWFFYWVPHLESEHGVSHFFMGTGLISGFKALIEHLPLVSKRFYETALKYIGFILFLIGLGWSIVKRNRPILGMLLCCTPAFLAVMVVSGYNFAHHTYYVIPFVPVMALLAGAGIRAINHRGIVIALLAAVCIEGVSDQQHDFRIKPHNKRLLALEADLDATCARDALILVNGSGSPTALYFAHRRGWSLTNRAMAKKGQIKSLQRRGLERIVILNNVLGATDMRLSLPVVLQRDAYTIYSIEIPRLRSE
ncbi:MAG: hypothetical protein HN341_07965 [Verrucomicrobia bacterium]|jgi:hypothetical protein|nr:hypothetical protein [Verrucomicrobiota bacterium]